MMKLNKKMLLNENLISKQVARQAGFCRICVCGKNKGRECVAVHYKREHQNREKCIRDQDTRQRWLSHIVNGTVSELLGS